jgi:hypothetical protein
MPEVEHTTGMSAYFAYSSHMPCPDCGVSVASGDANGHTCDPERLVEYRLFQLRDEVAGFESSFRAYLATPEGEFAQWAAEQGRAVE